ncbi:tryptophan synthase subunit alpha [Desulfocurvus sp. DL9XJH121]
MASRLTQAIEKANSEGHKALIPYLPAGFPDLDAFWEALKELDRSGADVIEIGVPFSDPVADGPTVEMAALECLERGVTLRWILAELKKHRAEIDAAIVLMGYLNPFLQYGLDNLARDAAEAGVNGFIVPDVPLEESGDFKAAIAPKGMDFVYLVGLNTPAERLEAYGAAASGFVYLVSVMGVTGARDSLPTQVKDKIAEVKAAIHAPLALGFGIKTPDQLKQFGQGPDAVVMGSGLIDHMRAGGAPAAFLAPWRA